jgi:carboxyl-terminal processing protease
MMKRSNVAKLLAVLIPTCVLVLALGVDSADNATDDLFAPVYPVYEDLLRYFYQPERIDDRQALYSALKGLVEQLGDPYSEFLSPEEFTYSMGTLDGDTGNVGLGIELSIVNGALTVVTPLPGTPAESAGIRPGDQILAIDGESTQWITLSRAKNRLRGERETSVVLSVRHRDGALEEITVVRDVVDVDPVVAELVGDGRIGYLRVLRFQADTTSRLDEAVRTLDLTELAGLVLDLRNNPGGLLTAALSVSSTLIDEGDVITQTLDRLQGEKLHVSTGNENPNLLLTVLINSGTAGASEIVAGAIRDNSMGVLVGERSFGLGVYQQVIEFPDGSALRITTGEYFTPSGDAIHLTGLEPDIPVDEDVDPLDVAIEWIQASAEEPVPQPAAAASDS